MPAIPGPVGAGGEFPLPVGDLARKLGKRCFVIAVKSLILDRWELFEQILYESLFFEHLTIPKGKTGSWPAVFWPKSFRRQRSGWPIFTPGNRLIKPGVF